MSFYTAEQLRNFPWVVCDRASLRPDDLADTYQSAIATIAGILSEPMRADGMPESLSVEVCARLERLAQHSGDCMGPDASEADWDALSEAEQWLGWRAPHGFYFGAHEGDGSLFGFWLTDEAAETLQDEGITSEDPTTLAIAVWDADYPHGRKSAALAAELVANPYAWPGGYPQFAVMSDGGALCPKCCAAERDSIASCNTSDGWQVTGLQINWEDANLTCSHCGAAIESAYGEAA